MDEAALRAQIRAEMEAEARAGASLRALAAATAAEGTQPRENYGRPPTENARIYGTVLAAQMLAGMTGTGLTDDGLGDGTGHAEM